MSVSFEGRGFLSLQINVLIKNVNFSLLRCWLLQKFYEIQKYVNKKDALILIFLCQYI
jgi:hypothetical protein